MEKNNPIVLVAGARRETSKVIALNHAKDEFDLVITDIAISDELSSVADEIT